MKAWPAKCAKRTSATSSAPIFRKRKKIRADHKTGSARAVATDPLDAQTLKDEIAKGGYRVLSVTHAPYTETGLVERISAFFKGK